MLFELKFKTKKRKIYINLNQIAYLDFAIVPSPKEKNPTGDVIYELEIYFVGKENPIVVEFRDEKHFNEFITIIKEFFNEDEFKKINLEGLNEV